MVSRVDIWVWFGGVFTTEKVMSRVGCLICPGGCKRNGGNGVQGGYMGLSWGGLHYRKSDVQGRMFDLSWGVCKTNGGNGVQGGYMGLSWGVFTTEKVMSRVGCLICPGGV